jgi:hypothetical protein
MKFIFGSGNTAADRREKSSFDKILMWHILLLPSYTVVTFLYCPINISKKT